MVVGFSPNNNSHNFCIALNYFILVSDGWFLSYSISSLVAFKILYNWVIIVILNVRYCNFIDNLGDDY